LQAVNEAVLAQLEPYQTIVCLCRADTLELEAEMDEMWSYGQSKQQQRWLWLAIDHKTRKVLADVLGSPADEAFLELKAVLEPFGIMPFYTDRWGAYERHLEPAFHTVGKRNTQRIERKHLTLRTRIKRLARKPICFSKSVLMHDVVLGLLINRLEFGLLI
jgi:insertion element IS1 protein InsB